MDIEFERDCAALRAEQLRRYEREKDNYVCAVCMGSEYVEKIVFNDDKDDYEVVRVKCECQN